jgi:hypothetical protein
MQTSSWIAVNFAQTPEQPVATLVSSVTSSPVPEPFSAALIGIGFVAAAFLMRFRQQRARRPQSNVAILAPVALPSVLTVDRADEKRFGAAHPHRPGCVEFSSPLGVCE